MYLLSIQPIQPPFIHTVVLLCHLLPCLFSYLLCLSFMHTNMLMIWETQKCQLLLYYTFFSVCVKNDVRVKLAIQYFGKFAIHPDDCYRKINIYFAFSYLLSYLVSVTFLFLIFICFYSVDFIWGLWGWWENVWICELLFTLLHLRINFIDFSLTGFL